MRPCCGCKNKSTPDAYYDGPSGEFLGECGCDCHVPPQGADVA